MSSLSYAGVGSRQTPSEILQTMKSVAALFAKKGWVLRSGGADGADKAFEIGCDSEKGKKEIYYAKDATKEAFELAAQVHPQWFRMGVYAKKLHARNCFQVLGKDLKTPALFVLCWTKDGANGTTILTSMETGGTGQAIRLAARWKIPVINMKISNWRDMLDEFYIDPCENKRDIHGCLFLLFNAKANIIFSLFSA